MSHQPHILIVGGAYAGISALNNLISLSAGKVPEAPQRGGRGGRGPPGPPPPDYASIITRPLRSKPRYTLLDERDGFYHSVGAPLGQISSAFSREFWLSYDKIVATRSADDDVRFVQGTAVGLDMDSKTLHYQSASNEKPQPISYDYLILATGMRRGAPVVPQAVDYETYMADVERFETELGRCSKIVLVGGGAVGIEMAAYMKVQFPRCNVVLIHSRDTLLSSEPLPDEYKAKALDLLLEGGVEVILGQRVLKEFDAGSGKELHLSGGQVVECDKVVYSAVQKGTNTEFLRLPKNNVDEKGCIRTRETLQFPEGLPNAGAHFASGDIVCGTFIKRSGPAQMMGQTAAVNIVASLLALEDGKSASDLPLVKFSLNSKPAMSLAVGEQAMALRTGIIFGREVKQRAFGRALGLDGTLAKLRIEPNPKPEISTHPRSVGNGVATASM